MGAEREFLGEFGLDLREAFAIGGEESVKRYLTKADGTQVGARALAEAAKRMADQAQAAGPSTPAGPQMSPEQMREQQRVMSYQLAEAVVTRPA